jgi:hypothetical protein
MIKVILHTKSMKIVRRSTRHHNNKKLTCSNSAKRNHRTSKPWTPHPTFTFYARRAVKMIKAFIPASWLACLCIKEKLVLKSDQGISAYFFSLLFNSQCHWKYDFQTDIARVQPRKSTRKNECKTCLATWSARKPVGATSTIFPMLGSLRGIRAPRGHALLTKHIHSMIAVPLSSSRAAELPPLDSEHAECCCCSQRFLVKFAVLFVLDVLSSYCYLKLMFIRMTMIPVTSLAIILLWHH